MPEFQVEHREKFLMRVAAAVNIDVRDFFHVEAG
jgi:hypothetical protein